MKYNELPYIIETNRTNTNNWNIQTNQQFISFQTPYCPLIETLVPETSYVCVVYIRQKKEENKITDEGATVTSEIEKDFALEIPPGSFEGTTVLSLQVWFWFSFNWTYKVLWVNIID